MGTAWSRLRLPFEDQVEMFGVANVVEAEALRKILPRAAIFILGAALPEERPAVVAGRFVPAVSGLDEARAYSALASEPHFPIHIAIDTGMGRMGIWQEDALAEIAAIARLPRIQISGIGTHFPVADEDDIFTAEQLKRFRELTAAVRERGLTNIVDHAANSAGLIGFPMRAGEMVRAGLALYGSSPRMEFQSALAPVLTWKARLVLVRLVGAGRGISYGRTFITTQPTRVATVAVGYADGYQRHLSIARGRGADRRAPLPSPGPCHNGSDYGRRFRPSRLRPGDEAVLIGRQGDEQILAGELAVKAGTIPWEIFTGIGARVRARLFVIADRELPVKKRRRDDRFATFLEPHPCSKLFSTKSARQKWPRFRKSFNSNSSPNSK